MTYPTAVAVHGHALYLSNCGTCPATGQVIRVTLGDDDTDD